MEQGDTGDVWGVKDCSPVLGDELEAYKIDRRQILDEVGDFEVTEQGEGVHDVLVMLVVRMCWWWGYRRGKLRGRLRQVIFTGGGRGR